MPRIGKAGLIAICGASLVVCPAAGASATTLGTVTLSANAPDASGYAGPVSTSDELAAGKLFVANVSGAVSYYAQEDYAHPSGPWDTVCGNPLASAEGPLGADAEFIFARPWTSPCPEELPTHWSNFEVGTTSGSYSHPLPLGGRTTAPTAGHEYAYALVGAGGPAMFRLKDMPDGHAATADNYGHLTIRVRTADPADCAGYGYNLFGEPSEAACVAAASVPAELKPAHPTSTPSSSVLGVKFTSPKACVSGREFTIHIQNARALGLVSAIVSVDGRAKRPLRGSDLATVIDLRGLPKGTITVVIVARERNGHIVRGERVYHTCRSKPLRGKSRRPSPVLL